MDKYRLGRELGRGGAGVVWEALNCETGEAVAIKTVSLAALSAEDVDALHAEVNLLSRVSWVDGW